MLSRIWSPSKLDEQNHDTKKRYKDCPMDVGLRILIHLSQGDSTVIVKSSSKLSKTSVQRNRTPSITHESYFLKSCFLCNKTLSPDKDVYMYRGDQGFCSEECRNRQIYLDDMRELEASTKKMVASFRHCRTSGGCETSILLEEFRQRRKPLSYAKERVIFS